MFGLLTSSLLCSLTAPLFRIEIGDKPRPAVFLSEQEHGAACSTLAHWNASLVQGPDATQCLEHSWFSGYSEAEWSQSVVAKAQFQSISCLQARVCVLGSFFTESKIQFADVQGSSALPFAFLSSFSGATNLICWSIAVCLILRLFMLVLMANSTTDHANLQLVSLLTPLTTCTVHQATNVVVPRACVTACGHYRAGLKVESYARMTELRKVHCSLREPRPIAVPWGATLFCFRSLQLLFPDKAHFIAVNYRSSTGMSPFWSTDAEKYKYWKLVPNPIPKRIHERGNIWSLTIMHTISFVKWHYPWISLQK